MSWARMAKASTLARSIACARLRYLRACERGDGFNLAYHLGRAHGLEEWAADRGAREIVTAEGIVAKRYHHGERIRRPRAVIA